MEHMLIELNRSDCFEVELWEVFTAARRKIVTVGLGPT